MANGRNIRELTAYMMATRSAIVEGHARAIMEMTLTAERIAKQNVAKNFGDRSQRKLSGRLLNSIYSGFDVQPGLATGNFLPTGFVGTQGTPYGRIHELGGKIEPKDAEHLWVKNSWDADAWKINKRMSPSDWFKLFKSKQEPDYEFRFAFKPNGKVWAAGVDDDGEFIPLFYLKDEVDIPARPFITPAVTEATEDYAKVVGKHIRAALTKRFLG